MSVLPLMKKETIRTTHHLNTEEVVQRTQVLDGKLRTETISKPAKELRSACCQDDVVNIEKKIRRVGALVINKQRSIGACRAEVELTEERCDELVPSAGSLLEPI